MILLTVILLSGEINVFTLSVTMCVELTEKSLMSLILMRFGKNRIYQENLLQLAIL